MCAAVVYWRLPAYASWSGQDRPPHIFRVALDGLLAGLVIAIITSVSTWLDSTTVSWVDFLIWSGVLGSVGLLNALAVYAIALAVERAV